MLKRKILILFFLPTFLYGQSILGIVQDTLKKHFQTLILLQNPNKKKLV